MALDEAFLGEDTPRKVKARYLGTLYPVNAIPDPSWAFMLEWFQWDKDGNQRGIIALDPRRTGP
jgi:hypothetical protein